MRKVLITGIAGFVGSHLAERLTGRAEVWGTHIDDNLGNLTGIAGLKLVKCDLLDHKRVNEVIDSVRPDSLFHLAAQSNPSLSFVNPAETLKVNVFSALNIFEAVLKSSPDTVVLNVGSGDEYGDVNPTDLPVKESRELKPLNPYAVSKVTADLLGYQYWKSRGLKVIRCRPFNHLGPRQAEYFVASSFAKQIAEIEAGIKEEKAIKVGNLESSRDFLDVRDVVAAYELLMDKGSYGEAYNICSGSAVKIRDILEVLLSFSKEEIEVVKDMERFRSKDTTTVYGDAARLKSLGWSPKYSLEEGLKALLDYWRQELKRVF